MLLENHSKKAKDVPAHILTAKLAAYLKENKVISKPDWTAHVKTACFKETAPQDPDFVYLRAASILRRLYEEPRQGVGKFSRVYGGRCRRKMRKCHFRRAGKKLIRTLVQQLEGAGLVRKAAVGRSITPEGMRRVDNVANQVKLEVPELLLNADPEEEVADGSDDGSDEGESEEVDEEADEELVEEANEEVLA